MSNRQMASRYSAPQFYGGGGGGLIPSIMDLFKSKKTGGGFYTDPETGQLVFEPYTGYGASELNNQVGPAMVGLDYAHNEAENQRAFSSAQSDKTFGQNKEMAELKARLDQVTAQNASLIKMAEAAGLNVTDFNTTSGSRLSNFNKKLAGEGEALDRNRQLSATQGDIIQGGYENNPIVKQSLLNKEIGTNNLPLGALFQHTQMKAQPGEGLFSPMGSLFGMQNMSVTGSLDSMTKDPKTGLPMKTTIPPSFKDHPKPLTQEELNALSAPAPIPSYSGPFGVMTGGGPLGMPMNGPVSEPPVKREMNAVGLPTQTQAIGGLLDSLMQLFNFGEMNKKYPSPYVGGTVPYGGGLR